MNAAVSSKPVTGEKKTKKVVDIFATSFPPDWTRQKSPPPSTSAEEPSLGTEKAHHQSPKCRGPPSIAAPMLQGGALDWQTEAEAARLRRLTCGATDRSEGGSSERAKPKLELSRTSEATLSEATMTPALAPHSRDGLATTSTPAEAMKATVAEAASVSGSSAQSEYPLTNRSYEYPMTNRSCSASSELESARSWYTFGRAREA